jgi:hypothetical protein
MTPALRTSVRFLFGLLVFCASIFVAPVTGAETDEPTPPATASTKLAFPIEGLWYVLIHYTDDHAMDPAAWHWEDHLWSIQREDQKLRWRDFPIVIFDDGTGRFERIGPNPLSKVSGAWEPNPGQLENIGLGLMVNDRGAQAKRLKQATQEKADLRENGESHILWESQGAAPATSASMVTFSSTWRIEERAGMPIFSWNDLLDSGRAKSMAGRTEFRCEEIDEKGVVYGRFDRDGVRHGRFRLYPSGDIQPLKKKKKRLF